MIKQTASVCALFLLFVLTGCDETRILERTGFVQSVSIDMMKDGKLKVVASIPGTEPDTKSSRELLSTEASSVKESRTKISKQTDVQLVSGQIRTYLFGLSFARHGIWEHLDTIIRDPTIPERVKIIVVNGNAGELLSEDYPGHARTAKYIDRLIEGEAKKHTVPMTSLYSFARDYYDDGIDPIVPVIKKAGKKIVVDGVGLFQDDKYVGKINNSDTVVFALLYSKLRIAEISLDLSQTTDSKLASLSAITSSRKLKVNREADGSISVMINVKAIASVLEYIGDLSISENIDRHRLEQHISNILTKQANHVVKQLQEKKVDSLGIGKHVRNSMDYSSWKKIKWRDEYSNIKVQCNIKVKIKDYGFRH